MVQEIQYNVDIVMTNPNSYKYPIRIFWNKKFLVMM